MLESNCAFMSCRGLALVPCTAGASVRLVAKSGNLLISRLECGGSLVSPVTHQTIVQSSRQHSRKRLRRTSSFKVAWRGCVIASSTRRLQVGLRCTFGASAMHTPQSQASVAE